MIDLQITIMIYFKFIPYKYIILQKNLVFGIPYYA